LLPQGKAIHYGINCRRLRMLSVVGWSGLGDIGRDPPRQLSYVSPQNAANGVSGVLSRGVVEAISVMRFSQIFQGRSKRRLLWQSWC
jgi:hypothetical protein